MNNKTTIQLPASKSIANRALIINALSYSNYSIDNLSDCDDTRILQHALESNDTTFDTGAAGTTMRFLTAFLAKTVGEWNITGSKRMQERPIKILVEALNSIGAKIEYTKKEGFPPLRIYGSALQGGRLRIYGSVSSQYISALMMIAPYTLEGLRLELQGEIVSKPYIEMTAAIMKHFGVKVSIDYPFIEIAPQSYTPAPFSVEADWSAASYWYQWVAVRGGNTIVLPGLKENSIQGDQKVAELFTRLGVDTKYTSEGVEITPNKIKTKQLVYNFCDQPDLVQTVAVTCCLKGVPFKFKGLETLRIKETNRIEALISELEKIGFILTENKKGELVWSGKQMRPDKYIRIQTFDDHRMAMSFAVAKDLYQDFIIENPEVVSKSYPNFWEEIKKLKGDDI